MEFYNSVVARNPKLEMIFHSWDKDPAAMSTFVSKHGIRFPMFRHGVMKTKAGRDKMPTVAPHIQQKLPFVIKIQQIRSRRLRVYRLEVSRQTTTER